MHLHTLGVTGFHGYRLAKQMRDDAAARRLIAHGTLYKALERLETMGFLASEWEDPTLAVAESRPRRRLYHVTGTGAQALARATPAETDAGVRFVLRKETAS